jgi:carbonic anhydrase
LNVREQVMDLAKTSIVQEAWAERGAPALHGWVYDMENGRLKELLDLAPGSDQVDPIYRFDNLTPAKQPA